MKHLESIYRTYDIRGEYPNEIHEDEVYKIGCALVDFLKLKTVAIGRDIRPSADVLFNALKQGVVDQGGNVIDLGLVTSPMSYFVLNQDNDVDGVAMITASHLPPTFNGIKIYKRGFISVHGDELKKIESYIRDHSFEKNSEPGTVRVIDIKNEWREYFAKRFNFDDNQYSVVVDPANMIGVLEIDTLREFEPDLKIHTIFDDFDSTCPNHEANPVKFETLRDLGEKVIKTKSDIGIGFDGDADRVGFVDEKGEPVPSDVIGGIITNYLIQTGVGKDIVYTLTCTKALSELVERNGGVAHQSAVGRTNVCEIMRETDSMFGVELSGHFFFKEMGHVEGGILPVMYVLKEMQRSGKKLSELHDEIVTKFRPGEINSDITLSIEDIYTRLKEKYGNGQISELDGLRIDFNDWWFNVRPSANDPVMRLNLEADTKKLMESKMNEVLEIVRAKK